MMRNALEPPLAINLKLDEIRLGYFIIMYAHQIITDNIFDENYMILHIICSIICTYLHNTNQRRITKLRKEGKARYGMT